MRQNFIFINLIINKFLFFSRNYKYYFITETLRKKIIGQKKKRIVSQLLQVTSHCTVNRKIFSMMTNIGRIIEMKALNKSLMNFSRCSLAYPSKCTTITICFDKNRFLNCCSDISNIDPLIIIIRIIHFCFIIPM